MPTTHLKDTRKAKIQTMEEAAATFNDIARTEIAIERENAMFENRVATMKATHDAKLAGIRETTGLETKQAMLTEFIDNNRELFKQPRKHQTSLGAFGLETSSGLNWTDKDKAVEFLIGQKMANCIKTEHKPVSAGIKAALKAKVKIPGVSWVSGLIIKYKVDKTIIDEAKEV